MTDFKGFAEALLGGSEYNPYLARVRFDPQLGWYLMLGSPAVFEFVQLAYGRDGKIDSADAVTDDDPWPTSVCGAYFRLDARDRSEVMAFVCLTLHELIHNGDLLTTPTGAVFHTHLSAIARTLGGVAGWIADNASEFDCEPTVMRWRPSVPEQREALEELLTYEQFFRQMRKVQAADVRPGWPEGSGGTAALLSGEFALVTLFGSVRSAVMPGRDGWYVTPATILEGRALSACLLRLLYLFGGVEPARVFEEIDLFLRTYYPRSSTSPDYYCLLDVAARAFGLTSLEEALVRGRSIDQVAQLPRLVLALGWWALHGADPVDGALLALGFVRYAFARRQSLGTPEEVCAKIEEWVGEPSLHERAVRAYGLVEHARREMEEADGDRDVRAHFEHIFAVLQGHLEYRAEHGWRFPLCSPPRGSPFPYLSSEHQRDIGGVYQCPARFEDWVNMREEICHRWRPRNWKRAVVQRWLARESGLPEATA